MGAFSVHALITLISFVMRFTMYVAGYCAKRDDVGAGLPHSLFPEVKTKHLTARSINGLGAHVTQEDNTTMREISGICP